MATWDELSAVRNALAHVEHQKGPMKLEKIIKKAENEVMPRLMKLAQIWLPQIEATAE